MNKEELQKQLAEIEKQEQIEKDYQKRKENFEKFMRRTPDYMVGKAHAELSFINKRYDSERKQAVMPACVQVSGNCGKSYYPTVDVTNATKTYFHNVWNGIQETEFQEELNKLAHKYITKYAFGLQQRLEMMGLQSLFGLVNKSNFLEEDIPKVWEEIKKSRKEILDEYPDDDFRNLQKIHYIYEDGTEEINIDLSHSEGILKDYLKENRPNLYLELFPKDLLAK